MTGSSGRALCCAFALAVAMPAFAEAPAGEQASKYTLRIFPAKFPLQVTTAPTPGVAKMVESRESCTCPLVGGAALSSGLQ